MIESSTTVGTSQVDLPAPTPEYVARRIAEFDGDEQDYGNERAVSLVFEQWPTNTNYDQVLVKVVVLNQMYSTNIYDPYTVARHIVGLNIDARLSAGDAAVVAEIAQVPFRKARVLFSFATKYCSWHQPDRYQIYDSYVRWLLCKYRRWFSFASFRNDDLRDYPSFVRIVKRLVDHFHLHEFGPKKIDKFLWMEGRQHKRSLRSPKPQRERSSNP